MSAPSVLVIAGLDPSGNAGLLADAEAIRAMGARPLCVATALTVQTTRAVKRWEPVAPGLVQETAHALLLEENVRAIKIGMIGDARIAEAIGKLIGPRRDLPVIVDPVLQSSSGMLLFKGRLEQARDAYLELASHAMITPNLLEAAALLDLARQPQDAAGVEAAARALVAKGVRAALVKGGHLPGEPVDALAMGSAAEQFPGTRIPGKVRGTGCRLASALAAGLALERPIRDAVIG
ncbi:MAG: bifunctional hydroxymethylpyrimidine kinase/phosphomethylpyrimidine kinase, partial [Myxococcales bacterium]|nr:bifunctional hydroxymethylpyrimidine kinase/phosphomethylpyrimidine kinase [Myxococcales bacterium]